MALRLKKKNVAQTHSVRRKRRRVSDFSFANVGGYEAVKQEIRDAIVMPMRHPALYKRLRIRAPKGILLWGAPGTGKTLIARTIARECNAAFYHIRSSDIMSEWFGVSERRVKLLFQRASRTKPSIIFFDELESLAPNRQAMMIEDGRTTILSSLLSEIDGFEPLKQVTILAATNIPNRLDPALLRAGRFDKMIYIPPPTSEERKAILNIHLDGKPCEGIDLAELALKTNHFTGADLELLVNTATTAWLKRYVKNRKEIFSIAYFDEALRSIRPSLTPENARFYDSLRGAFERSGNAKIQSQVSIPYYG
jgi:transitional endoplasmic reticulum ATPase